MQFFFLFLFFCFKFVLCALSSLSGTKVEIYRFLKFRKIFTCGLFLHANITMDAFNSQTHTYLYLIDPIRTFMLVQNFDVKSICKMFVKKLCCKIH